MPIFRTSFPLMAESEESIFTPGGMNPANWDKMYTNKMDGFSVPILNTVVQKEVRDKFLNGEKGLDFFLPLCGRSPDMMWLASEGHRVTGVEWSAQAVKQFFVDNKLGYEVLAAVDVGKGKGDVYKAKGVPITIYLCDFFHLSVGKIGKFDRIWDNDTLAAFPNSQKLEYASIICDLMKPKATILLGTFHYDESLRSKPPFSVTPETIQDMYGAKFDITLVQREGVEVFRNTYKIDAIFDPRTFPYFNWNFHYITPKA